MTTAALKRFIAENILFEAPKRYWNIGVLNFLPIQIARIAITYSIIAIKDTFSKSTSSELCQHLREINENGYTLIENIFEYSDFKELQRITEAQMPNADLRTLNCRKKVFKLYKIDGTGIKWDSALSKKIASHKVLLKIAEKINRTKVRIPPHIHINQDEHIAQRNAPPKDEWQDTLHADVYYPTLKVIVALEDLTIENGTFEYLASSNKMTLKRVIGEYVMSWFYYKRKKQGELVPSANNLLVGVNPVTKPMVVPENTAILFDARGFHKRGTGEIGKRRRVMFIDFRRSQSPMNTLLGIPILKNIFKNFSLDTTNQETIERKYSKV